MSVFKSKYANIDIPLCTVQQLLFKDIMTDARKDKTAFFDVLNTSSFLPHT